MIINSSLSLLDLPHECVCTVTSFLSFKDILTFDLLAKGTRTLTEREWEKQAKKEHLYFDWSSLHSTPHRERTRYLMGKILFVYIESREKLIKNLRLEEGDEMYQRVKNLMIRYPLLTYIWKDLNFLYKLNPSPQEREIFETNLSLLENSQTSFAGDQWVKGLSHLTGYLQELKQEEKFDLGLTCIEEATFKGAIQSGRVAISILLNSKNFIDKISKETSQSKKKVQRLLDIAQALAKKTRDYRVVDHLLKTCSWKREELLGQQTDPSPPILFAQADCYLRRNYPQISALLDRAIKDYGDFVPAECWSLSAFTKLWSNQVVEAEQHMEKALPGYKNKIPGCVLFDAIGVKMALKKWEEAEIWLSKWMAGGNCIPGRRSINYNNLYLYAAIIHANLNQLENTKRYLRLIKDSYCLPSPMPGFLNLAGTWEEYKQQLPNQLQTCYVNSVPADYQKILNVIGEI